LKLKKKSGDVQGRRGERLNEQCSSALKLVGEGCPVKVVCENLQLPRATYYRRLKPSVKYGPPKPRSEPPNKIPIEIRNEILDITHEDRFLDATPDEIVPQLLDEGIYLASSRTFYRILAEANESGDRRLQARRPQRSAPVLEATKPNQVWSRDITRLKGSFKGEYYFLYLMIDLYSRYVVGWMIAKRENATRARQFLEECVKKHIGNKAKNLTIHSDNGSPMIATSTRSLLQSMSIVDSYSRPRVSNDNAMSESIFKSLKYGPKFPGWFNNQEHAEHFMTDWVLWYNQVHKHSGISLLTPETVFKGETDEVIRKRQLVLDKAYRENTIRFPKGRPVHPRPPEKVGINLMLKENTEEKSAFEKKKTTLN
jgi:putative transposase